MSRTGSNYYRQEYVNCPFWKDCNKGVNNNYIKCEGVGNASSLTLRYASAADLMNQLNHYCCSGKTYEKCEVHRMLMREKYDDLEE